MQLLQTKDVNKKFNSYPKEVRPKMELLRELILDTAKEIGINKLEETLKWGEPSYIAPQGSTLRIDWKAKSPEQYAMYFKCTSKLVVSFIEVFGDRFKYENHRAILFDMNESIPVKELKKCIAVTLTYHEVKQLPLLGL